MRSVHEFNLIGLGFIFYMNNKEKGINQITYIDELVRRHTEPAQDSAYASGDMTALKNLLDGMAFAAFVSSDDATTSYVSSRLSHIFSS